MLEDYCIKAKLQDGMHILDMGCGWGSLSLFLAKVLSLSTTTTSYSHFNPTSEISKFNHIFSIQLSYSKDLHRQHRHSSRFN